MTDRSHDYRVICDRSGIKYWASECVEEWTGLFVHRRFVDTRSPQERTRPVTDRQTVPIARPDNQAFLSDFDVGGGEFDMEDDSGNILLETEAIMEKEIVAYVVTIDAL